MASNIFEEIGFDKAEADNLRIRSALMREIVNYINAILPNNSSL